MKPMMATAKRNEEKNKVQDISAMSSNSNNNPLHRFPYASTPSVSPVLNITTASQDSRQIQKSNMKLAVGALAPNGGEKAKHPFPLHNIATRNRYLQEHDASTASISPIEANGSRHPIQFTEPRGGRQLFPVGGAPQRPNGNFVVSSARDSHTESIQSDSGNSSGGTSKTVFPYPSVPVLDDLIPPGEKLCNSLKILVKLKNLEQEKQRLMGQKRKQKIDEKVAPYEFTKDSFNFNNSEAATHALYLLFTSVNAKEAETRFRDCWPVYEKKLEGIFRRVALEWIKELIEANSEFFKSTRVETLGGLLVNPGGDRFISMMRQLCVFVMYTMAERKKGVVKKQLLLPPMQNPDPEVTNRHLHVLTHRTYSHHQQTVEKYKLALKIETAACERQSMFTDLTDRINSREEVQAARLKRCIINHPHIFGSPTEDELREREAKLLGVKIQQFISDEPYEDFLRLRIEGYIKEQAENIYKPTSLLLDALTDFDKIWHILEVDHSKPIVLNCNNLYPHQLQNETGGPSLNSFFDYLISKVDDTMEHSFLNKYTPENLLKDFQHIKLRMSYLGVLEGKIKEYSAIDVSGLIEVAKRDIDILKIQLDSYDWSTSSNIRENRVGTLLDMTPLRVFDINRVSGRTPGINNFLDSSSSSSSGGNSTIVKRRNAQKTLSRGTKWMLSDAKKNRIEESLQSFDSTPVNSNSRDTSRRSAGKYESDKIALTPVSNLFSTSSFSQRTAISPPRQSSSLLSLSIGDTSTCSNTGNLLEHSDLSTHSTTSAISNTAGNISQKKIILSPDSTLNGDQLDSSRMSTTSDFNFGLDISTQERLSRLLESVAPNNRSSLSPIPDSNCSRSRSPTPVNHSECASDVDVYQVYKRPSVRLKNEKEMCVTQRESVASFENVSLIDDWEEAKGIMETSHIELFRNSDSDESS